MWVNAGRLLMVCVWAILLLNLVAPFPAPLNWFVIIAFIFMIIMHGLQLLLLRTSLSNSRPRLSRLTQLKIFFFGVFELLAWQKKQAAKRS